MAHAIGHSGHIWRSTRYALRTPPQEKGLDRAWVAATGLLRNATRRTAKYMSLADGVLRLSDGLGHLSDADLRDRAETIRRDIARGISSSEAHKSALAITRESARRHLGMHPFRVQIAGAAAILDGTVIEMATGEGKTLVAGIAAVVLAWRGRGCHVVTVNDYLAERDAQWMVPLFRSCGLNAGTITQADGHSQRRIAYARDITYTTNKEVAADFLRDQLAMREDPDPTHVVLDTIAGHPTLQAERLLQRGLEHAIVDEADSILIDEAVTPLIISSPAQQQPQARQAAECARELADTLRDGRDYRVDRKHHEIRLTSEGGAAVDLAANDLHGVWRGRRRAHELVVQALVARELFHKDRQYIVRDGRPVIVDEFTGRVMPDRTWRNGLQEAIEAKEGLDIQPQKDTIARVSFQRFFRSYRHLSGMTGTARESRSELWTIYRLPTVPIPTNRPSRRTRLGTAVASSLADKWAAVVAEIDSVHSTGRPVLVGTRTVEASEHLSGLLRERGIEHQVLNAIRHDREAEIIARAGEAGCVTIATNMAGRGTDIRLGPEVAGLGGLHVIATEPHPSKRIDRQLFGRAARQGDPGSGRLFASLEDELIIRHGRRAARGVRALASTHLLGRALVTTAQHRAQHLARQQRDSVARSDEWIRTGLGFAGPGPT